MFLKKKEENISKYQNFTFSMPDLSTMSLSLEVSSKISSFPFNKSCCIT